MPKLTTAALTAVLANAGIDARVRLGDHGFILPTGQTFDHEAVAAAFAAAGYRVDFSGPRKVLVAISRTAR